LRTGSGKQLGSDEKNKERSQPCEGIGGFLGQHSPLPLVCEKTHSWSSRNNDHYPIMGRSFVLRDWGMKIKRWKEGRERE